MLSNTFLVLLSSDRIFTIFIKMLPIQCYA